MLGSLWALEIHHHFEVTFFKQQYLALFTQIDLEAAKRGLLGLPKEQIPKFRNVIRLGWVFLIPLSILVYTLMIENWEAGKAGMVAVIGVLVVGALQKETRPSFKKIVAAFEDTGKTLLDIAVITASIGVFMLAADFAGFALGAATVAWEWNQRQHRSQSVTASAAITR